jgi:hypothetical protein
MSTDFDDKQTRRLAALDSVLHLFRGTDVPPPADVCAMAEWVLEGSLSGAMALIHQQSELYGREYREDS